MQGTIPRDAEFKQPLFADIDGLGPYAAARYVADGRQALERLFRYVAGPALANARLQTNAAGQVVLTLKMAWRDGTALPVMSPLEFMQCVAALAPGPRLCACLSCPRS